jgi:small-conductance mechanosensitive channel
MASIYEFFGAIREFLSIPLFKLGDSRITLWSVLYMLVLIVLLLYLSGRIRKWLADKLLARSRLEPGVRQAAGSIIRYFIIVIGFLIILQTAGIDLTTLNVLAGAVGIGVGFGLQHIVNNFISGLILLFERPIKIGDRIEVGEVEGDVTSIGARATTVVTNDNIAIIVPNSSFIVQNIINWSYTDLTVRFKIGVSVAYGSNPRTVEKLLLEVADMNPDVLKAPAPVVRFLEFGDNGILFELRAWNTSLIHKKGKLISDLNIAIYDAFTANGIVFPYPQRDIHLHWASSKSGGPSDD